jgi:hypothetical protein
MKKKRLLFVVLGLCFVAMAGIIIYYARPIIYYPKEEIHNRLLKDTPIGSDKKQVLEYVRKKGYTFDPNGQGSMDEKWGNNYMRVDLGHYQGIPLRCDIVGAWVFDKDEKLINIDVRKEYDGP